MYKKMRWCALLMIASFTISAPTFSAVKPVPVNILVNDAVLSPYDEEVKKDVPAYIINGRTLMPLKKTFDVYGVAIKWDAKTRVIEAKTDSGEIIWLQIGNKNAKVKGATVSLDVPAQIINNRTYVPVAFVAKALGKDAQWDATNKLVKLYTDGTEAINLKAIPTGYGNVANRVNGSIFFDGENGKMISVTQTQLGMTEAVNLLAQMNNIQADDFVMVYNQNNHQIVRYTDEFSGMKRLQYVIEKNQRTFMIEIRGMEADKALVFVKAFIK